tara:strand:+ start:361 stop:1182 length:822 start_codon:yes stop_codon:yes gene_type:complete
MKLKHNKKRNTAFLFEVLAREIVKNTISNNLKRKDCTISLIKEYFSKNTALGKELRLYKALMESENMKPYVAEKLIQEAKISHAKINKASLFKEQSALISKINKRLSKDVFSNFVPNYKNMATIFQIFGDGTTVKARVLLESAILEQLTVNSIDNSREAKNVGNLALRNFVKKYNETYSGQFLEEQSALLNHYIMSFSDNGIDLKIFLNEEISRLKGVVNSAFKMEVIKADDEMGNKTKQVLNLLEGFKNKKIDKDVVGQILKIQGLAREITE